MTSPCSPSVRVRMAEPTLIYSLGCDLNRLIYVYAMCLFLNKNIEYFMTMVLPTNEKLLATKTFVDPVPYLLSPLTIPK